MSATGPSDRSAVAVAVSAGSHTVRIPMPTTSAATPSSATRATRARRTSTNRSPSAPPPAYEQPFHHRRDSGQTPIGADPRRGGNRRAWAASHPHGPTARPSEQRGAAMDVIPPPSPDPSGRRFPEHAAARGRARSARVAAVAVLTAATAAVATGAFGPDGPAGGRGRAALLRRLRRAARPGTPTRSARSSGPTAERVGVRVRDAPRGGGRARRRRRTPARSRRTAPWATARPAPTCRRPASTSPT